MHRPCWVCPYRFWRRWSNYPVLVCWILPSNQLGGCCKPRHGPKQVVCTILFSLAGFGLIYPSVPLLIDGDFALDSFDSTLFPGLPSTLKAHGGFLDAQNRGAAGKLAAVKKALATYPGATVATVGHSLGEFQRFSSIHWHVLMSICRRRHFSA